MLPSFSSVALAAMLALSGAGCGYSPLLNHVNEEDLDAARRPERRQAECDLKLPSLGACLRLAWNEGPRVADESKAVIESDVGLRDLNVVLWMPDMGHGSAPVVVTRESETRFSATEIHFIMPGVWEIRIEATDAGGRVESGSLRVEL